jgi:hypothetical protein
MLSLSQFGEALQKTDPDIAKRAKELGVGAKSSDVIASLRGWSAFREVRFKSDDRAGYGARHSLGRHHHGHMLQGCRRPAVRNRSMGLRRTIGLARSERMASEKSDLHSRVSTGMFGLDNILGGGLDPDRLGVKATRGPNPYDRFDPDPVHDHLVRTARSALIPPAALFILGWGCLWIGRGFKGKS